MRAVEVWVTPRGRIMPTRYHVVTTGPVLCPLAGDRCGTRHWYERRGCRGDRCKDTQRNERRRKVGT